jgi:GntR family transcriptional regulator, transcriptional repressor for pyruvate dehydrogenase complex
MRDNREWFTDVFLWSWGIYCIFHEHMLHYQQHTSFSSQEMSILIRWEKSLLWCYHIGGAAKIGVLEVNAITLSDKSDIYRPQYERVAELIGEYIAQMHLQPGDRLPTELEFSEQFGVSRTIVRDAIKMLTPSGLVRTKRGSGIFVGDAVKSPQMSKLHLTLPVPPDRIRELFEFRRFQEMQTARLAAQHITVAELRTLEGWLSKNRESLKTEDRITFLSSDDAFHQSIAQASHNYFFVESITSVIQLQRWAVQVMTGGAPGSSIVAVEQHIALFEAIRDGDADRAAESARVHVEFVFDSYQREVSRRLIGENP